MRTSKQIFQLAFGAFFFLLVGCTAPININLDSSATRLVIYGEVTTDTCVQQVSLSKSAEYFSNKPVEPVSGAHVTIQEGNNVYVLTESATTPGTYETLPTFLWYSRTNLPIIC